MKRRLLSTLLALCMALALLPGYALAFDAPEATDYWTNLDYTEATRLIEGIRDKNLTENTVLVLYSPTCPRSQALVPQIPGFAAENGIHIYGAGNNRLPTPFIQLFPNYNIQGMTPFVIAYNAAQKKYTISDTVTSLSTIQKQLQDNGLLDSTDPVKPELKNDATVSEQEWGVLRLVNQHRMGKNLQPLSVFDSLQKVANQRAYELAFSFSHDRPDGTSCTTAYTDYQVSHQAAAENIAAGQTTSTEVMNSWLNSTGHRGNIEDANLTHLGVGHYAAGTNYWAQNFAGSSCRFTNLSLSESTIAGKPGTNLETLLTSANIKVTAVCSQHGECRLPLIAAMCGDEYDMDAAETQTLTVTYGGETASLVITGTGSDIGHDHDWGTGVETTPASCTETGIRTYTCTVCGEEKTEEIPATGHRFVENADGDFICENGCGSQISKQLNDAYEVLAEKQKDEQGNPPVYSEEDQRDAAIKAFIEDEAAALLPPDSACTVRCEKIEERSYAATSSRTGLFVYNLVLRAESPARAAVDTLTVGPFELVLPKVSDSSDETYYISIPTPDHGQVTPSTRHAARNERVTLSVRADSGYLFEDLTVTDIRGRNITLRNLGDGKYSFSMPSSQVTVQASFSKEPDQTTAPADDELFTGLGTPGISGIVLNPAPMPFTDVRAGDWFYNHVDYVWKHYLMSGVSDTRFAPTTTTSRAMIWTVLARMKNIRTDVNPGSTWYERGMLWAIQQGVSDGSSPMTDITREQLATMLWRSAGSPYTSGDLTRFADHASVSSYAAAAMRWAVSNNIMQGANGRLNPQGSATRAEVAAMVMRYAENIAQ